MKKKRKKKEVKIKVPARWTKLNLDAKTCVKVIIYHVKKSLYLHVQYIDNENIGGFMYMSVTLLYFWWSILYIHVLHELCSWSFWYVQLGLTPGQTKSNIVKGYL